MRVAPDCGAAEHNIEGTIRQSRPYRRPRAGAAARVPAPCRVSNGSACWRLSEAAACGGDGADADHNGAGRSSGSPRAMQRPAGLWALGKSSLLLAAMGSSPRPVGSEGRTKGHVRNAEVVRTSCHPHDRCQPIRGGQVGRHHVATGGDQAGQYSPRPVRSRSGSARRQSCHARRATQYIGQTGQIVRDPAFGQYSAVLVDEREVMVAIAASTGPKPLTKGRRDDRFAHKSPSWAWPRN